MLRPLRACAASALVLLGHLPAHPATALAPGMRVKNVCTYLKGLEGTVERHHDRGTTRNTYWFVAFDRRPEGAVSLAARCLEPIAGAPLRPSPPIAAPAPAPVRPDPPWSGERHVLCTLGADGSVYCPPAR